MIPGLGWRRRNTGIILSILGIKMNDTRVRMEEEEYWNDSVAKGFSWEEGDDTMGMPDLRFAPIKNHFHCLAIFLVQKCFNLIPLNATRRITLLI